MTRLLKALVPLGLLVLTAQTCTVRPPPPPGPPPVATRTFFHPRSHGAIIDWCAPWARNCGRRTANRFCRRRGYRRAVSWRTMRPGRTWVMISRRHCVGPVCTGFRRVRCIR